MKVTPIRKDIASGIRYPKEELTRFVVVDGQLIKDEEKKLPGRGVYLRLGGDAKRTRKAFERLLRRPLTPEEEALLGLA